MLGMILGIGDGDRLLHVWRQAHQAGSTSMLSPLDLPRLSVGRSGSVSSATRFERQLRLPALASCSSSAPAGRGRAAAAEAAAAESSSESFCAAWAGQRRRQVLRGC